MIFFRRNIPAPAPPPAATTTTTTTTPTTESFSSPTSLTSLPSSSSGKTPTNPAVSKHPPQGVKDSESPLPKYKRDLVQKMKVLRQELSAVQPQAGHCRLEVSREEIFEVCYQ